MLVQVQAMLSLLLLVHLLRIASGTNPVAQQQPSAPADVSSRPNIIFILTDDLGSADVSFFHAVNNQGASPIHTPNIDRLAAHGVVLTRHYAQSTCAPSRTSLLTGQFPHRMGNPFPIRGEGGMPAGVPTFVQKLRTQGYRTAMVGKWGVDGGPANSNSEYGPIARGFESFYGLYESAHNHYSKLVIWEVDWHNLTTGATSKWPLFAEPPVDTEPQVHSTDMFTREAIKVIDTWGKPTADGKTQPGFLYLAYTAPHDPLLAVPRLMDHPYCRKYKNWRRRAFCAMVVHVDEGVGNLTSALEARGLLQDTVMVFTSDNGGSFNVGGMNFPFRGGKSTLYEGGLRVPALLHAPSLLGNNPP
eukprot:g49785.t1